MVIRKRWISVTVVALLAAVVLAGCGGPSGNRRLTIEVTTPSTRGNVTEPEVMVSGVVSDAAATLRINDAAVSVSADGAFSHTVPLTYGTNRINLRAEKEGMNPSTRSLTVNRALTLTITSPEKASETAENLVTITGTISDPTARITVTGQETPVGTDGTFSVDVPLYYVETVINVTAHVDETAPVTETLTIIRPEA
jgi:hypothetical protein